jgi:hypothetical protein
MSGEAIGHIHIDESIAEKIAQRPGGGCTPEEVREALLWPAKVTLAWDDDADHGRRLVAMGATSTGRLLIGWLLPVPWWEENPDTWVLKTARWV